MTRRKALAIAGAVSALLIAVVAAIVLAVTLLGGVTEITIGTGSTVGVYYPAGRTIAAIINRDTDKHGIRALVFSTTGSVENIERVLAGRLTFGLAQSDRQYEAWHGRSDWSDDGRPRESLRAVCSLHPEAVTVVVTDKSGIRKLADLKGRRVNIGQRGSGHHRTGRDVLEAAGVKPDKYEATQYDPFEQATMLREDRIDAFFYAVGHPSQTISEAAGDDRDAAWGDRKVRFLEIGPDLRKKLPEPDRYTMTSIPHRLYPNLANTEDVQTIGVVATIVTSASVPDDTVSTVLKAIRENLEEIRRSHPALSRLNEAELWKGLSADKHPGAARHFRHSPSAD